jgi:uncharacterized protein YqjF (DUF2071 family)
MPGVYRQGDKWAVSCAPGEKKKMHVGVFATEELARRTYDKCMLLLNRPSVYYRTSGMTPADTLEVQRIMYEIPETEMEARVERLRETIGTRSNTHRRPMARDQMATILEGMCLAAITKGAALDHEEIDTCINKLVRALKRARE